ncbi:MAG: prolipoprotein diacylglyceryl transferase [Candidatus Buchananbacteria bacterium]
MNFLHNYIPHPIFFQLGDITIRFYSLFIILAIIVCLITVLFLAKKNTSEKNISDDIFDLALWLIIGGIIGARLYDVFLIDWSYFRNHLVDIIKIWQGGIAIHGAIIGGLISSLAWAKIKKRNFWKFAALIFTVLPLGQAIGRWGNYFNQELFGRPTNLPWGIPISLDNRQLEYSNFQYFHPTFFYESILNLILFFVLLFVYKKNRLKPIFIPIIYLMGYSIIRFSTEFIRIDPTPVYFGLRLPQIASLIIFIALILFLLLRKFRRSVS